MTYPTLPNLFYRTKTTNFVLTLVGCILLLFVASQVLALLLLQLSGISLATFTAPKLDDPNAHVIRILLLVIQGLTSLLIFVGSSWITLSWSANAYVSELNTKPNFTIKQAGWVFLLCMISIPAIGYSSELNQMLDFSWLGADTSAYIKANEAKLADLTKFLVSIDGFGEGLLLMLVVTVIAAVSEELLFRGLIQNVLLKASGNPHIAIWATAFLFGFIHMQFETMLPRVLLGALFGYIYFWSGNLYLAMAGHFINNFVTAVGMIALVEANLPTATLDAAPWWAGALSAVSAIFAAYLFRRQLLEAE